MPKAIDLTGIKLGMLTCIVPNTSGKLRKWNCKCDCGNVTVVATNKLTSGHTRSCGCMALEVRRNNGKLNFEHGRGHGVKDLTYKSWTSMRERCRPNYSKSKYYFDRGIRMSERWNSFANFLADMGERGIGETLDRIDVNGNYEPANCRWASAKTQQRNRRNTNYLRFKDEKRIAMDVADEIGIKKSAMQYFLTVSRKLIDKYGYIPTP